MSNPPSTTLNTPLRAPKTLITGHSRTGHAEIHATRPATWTSFEGGQMGFNQIYTNPVPIDLNEDADLAYHDEKTSYAPTTNDPENANAKPKKSTLGLAVKGGTVCRMVDFAPGYVCMMHRTQSLDFGIVVEGEVDLVLDDGSVSRMGRGDVAVQRATMHSWRNPSETDWARMVFVLQDTKPVIVNGQRFGEDLGRGTEGIPPSGNDD